MFSGGTDAFRCAELWQGIIAVAEFHIQECTDYPKFRFIRYSVSSDILFHLTCRVGTLRFINRQLSRVMR
jgi:hypothetical protein